MSNQNKGGGVRKALYLLLTSILGALLFITLQRAIVLLYVALLNYNYATFSLGLSWLAMEAINYFSLVIGAFFGAWYGVWLGLHWYEIVYEKLGGHVWPAFSGKLFDHSHTQNKPATVANNIPKPALAPESRNYKLSDIKSIPAAWSIEDLETVKTPKISNGTKKQTTIKPVVKKSTKRPSRKTKAESSL